MVAKLENAHAPLVFRGTSLRTETRTSRVQGDLLPEQIPVYLVQGGPPLNKVLSKEPCPFTKILKTQVFRARRPEQHFVQETAFPEQTTVQG